MPRIQTTKFVGYPWADLFNLVLDVRSYPEFVPHCREVRLLSHRMTEPGMTIIVSRMTVGFSAFEVSYANRTTADTTGRQISIAALDGPLRFLNAVWRFEPRDEDQLSYIFGLRIEQSGAGSSRVALIWRNVSES
ncbi:MAG: SRPBCC family protein [Pseudolabrys sp.]